jgi:hypothetical protein
VEAPEAVSDKTDSAQTVEFPEIEMVGFMTLMEYWALFVQLFMFQLPDTLTTVFDCGLKAVTGAKDALDHIYELPPVADIVATLPLQTAVGPDTEICGAGKTVKEPVVDLWHPPMLTL